mgnify:FL=1
MKTKIYLLGLIAIAFVSCKKEQHIVVTNQDYNASIENIIDIMIHDIFSPPVASRIYAYPNIAAYEVLNAENGKYQSLTNQLNGLKTIENLPKNQEINKPLAALIAYLDVAKELVFSKEELIEIPNTFEYPIHGYFFD